MRVFELTSMADPMSYMGSQSGERPLCRSEAYAGDLLSKLLQIEFDIGDSLFQGLCSSGICSFLSELPYYREMDSLLRAPVPSRSQIAPPTTRPTRQRPNSQGSPQNERSVSTRSSSMITLNSNCTHSAMGPFVF